VTGIVHYCTLFDSRYAARALVMLDSLARHARPGFEVTILAMDDDVPTLLARVGKANWRVMRITDLDDPDFIAVKVTRPHREFCWTAAPVLCNSLLRAAAEGDVVTYLDADLMFYDDPALLLDELGVDGSILIHEHRYSPDRVQWVATSGRFNVGFVSFRAGLEARRCAQRWRDQVIAVCVLDPDNGLCGDQGYLNEWPELYPGLRIMRHIGGGTAPWNLDSYQHGGTPQRPTIDGQPLVFFHYHAFKMADLALLGPVVAQPARGYAFSRRSNRLFFSRYAKALRVATRLVRRTGFEASSDEILPWKDAARAVASGRYILAL
jgi:hypothetical protein